MLSLLGHSELGASAAATPGAHCGLHVFISNPTLLFKLQHALRQAGCVAEQRRSHELEVYLPDAPNPDQARRELNIYLATWQAINPGVDAYIIESPGQAESG